MKHYSIFIALTLPIFGLIALLSLFTPPVHALDVGGLISTDTTWTLANSPYIMKNDIIIESGVTLTVDAGVEVVAENDSGMQVYGHLNITGTPTATTVISNLLSIQMGESGSANIEYAQILANTTNPLTRHGIGIFGDSNNIISIAHSTIKNAVHPIITAPNSIHRLQMDNVTFTNNVNNKVFISKPYPITNELSQDVVLTAQPGLEGYELIDLSYLNVPEGITLTLEAGAALLNSSESLRDIDISGHLVVNGQITNTALITGFGYVVFYDSGSADINYAHIFANNFDYRIGVGVFGNSKNLVSVTNSTIENAVYPILADADSLHRLQMDNVAFANNVNNKVFISKPYSGELSQNVFLTSQPGLEGYELLNYPSQFNLPEGITLTLEAGVSLINVDESYFNVAGHLITKGTITNTVLITGFSVIDFRDTGIGNINHTRIVVNDTDPSTRIGIHVGNKDFPSPVSVKNSSIENAIYPILSSADSFHRLQLDNVTFANNINDQVFIYTDSGIMDENDSLSHDVVLLPQPGLEGYTVIGDNPLQIPEGVTMTVQAGASLLISDSGKVEVYGRLETNGTPFNPVTITSAADSAPGQWEGIAVHGGEVDLQNTGIRYGITNLTLISPTSSVTLSHTHIISASDSGIQVQDGQLNAECSALLDNNVGLAVENSGNSSVFIQQSEISGNSYAGISNTHTTSVVNGRFNWWGTTDGPSGDYAGSGDAAYGQVNATPWLTNTPDCSQPIEQLFLPMIVKP